MISIAAVSPASTVAAISRRRPTVWQSSTTKKRGWVAGGLPGQDFAYGAKLGDQLDASEVDIARSDELVQVGYQREGKRISALASFQKCEFS